MTKYKHQPETLAKKDVSYVREKVKRLKESGLSTNKAIKEIQKEYPTLPYGRIQWYLKEQADDKREQDKQLIREANEREKSKVVERRNRKQAASDGKWVIPNSISKSTMLKLTAEQERMLTQLSFGIKAFTCYVLEATAKGIQPNYDLVKKFLKKNDKLPAKMLDVIQRTKIKTMIQSSIRKPRFTNFTIPFQGSHGNTSGNGKIVSKNGKFYLRFNKMDLEILFQDHDDYYDNRIEVPLKQLFEMGETPSGEILKAKNDKWYVKFSLKRKEPVVKFDEDSKFIIMVVQPTFTRIGCKWIAYFYSHENQQVFKTTILKDVAWIRIPHTEKNYIKYYVDKAVNQLMEKSWHKNFMLMKPIVVLLDAVGKAPSQKVANLNPTYKLRFRLQDKLAQYSGNGYTLSNCPIDIEEIRARLSL